jgi:ABC-type lipoprotein release transport system permease subunit
MMLYLRMAWRNIWRHRRRTLIVILAIGLSLWLMMFYDAMISGFTQAIYANAIRVFGGNIQVHAPGYREQEVDNPLLPLENDQSILDAARSLPQIEMAAKRVNTSGIVTSREGAFSVNIIGIEPDIEKPISLLAKNVSDGRFLEADDQDVAFIGMGLATAMDLQVGDRFTLAGRSVHDQMRQRTLTVAGIYDLGLPQVEKSTVYLSLPEAQNLYGLDEGATEVAITLKQLGQEPQVIKALQNQLNGYEIESWEANYPEMNTAINRKSGAMNIFGFIMFFIAAIGILNMLMMAVFERTREIGVLGALGMKPGQITALFLLEGAMMGFVGVVFGAFLGIFLNFLFSRIGIDYSQFSGMTEYTALISGRIYTTLGVEHLLSRTVSVLVISLIASIYPAVLASRYEPAQALHTV